VQHEGGIDKRIHVFPVHTDYVISEVYKNNNSLEFCRLCLLCPLFSPSISYCICFHCDIFRLFCLFSTRFRFPLLCPFLSAYCICRYLLCPFRLCRLLSLFISVYVLFSSCRFHLLSRYLHVSFSCLYFHFLLSFIVLGLAFRPVSFFCHPFYLLSVFAFFILLFPVFVLFSLTLVLIFCSLMFHFVLQLFLLHIFILFGSASCASVGCCFSVCKMIRSVCKLLCR